MTADFKSIVTELQAIVGDDYVIYRPEDLIVFEYDGSVDKSLPTIVALPNTTDEVTACVRVASEHGMPIVARGAGTGLSGGAVAAQGGIVLPLTRMTRILEVDVEKPRRYCRAGRGQPGPYRARLTVWSLLRPRSVEPARLHHRRKCCGKLRWTPLSRIRRYHEPRSRA